MSKQKTRLKKRRELKRRRSGGEGDEINARREEDRQLERRDDR